jgi:hypothetical protein
LTINPVRAGAFELPPIPLTNYETIAEKHLGLCEPLLRRGSHNEGPRLPGAEVSFIAAADFALFMESRSHVTLLWDLERLYRENQISHIEFVTDLADEGSYESTVRAFARSYHLSYRVITLRSPRLGAIKSLSSAINFLANKLHPHGAAYTAYGRAFVRHRMFTSMRQQTVEDALGNSVPPRRLRVAMLFFDPKSGRHLFPIREQLLEDGHEVLLISPRLETDKVLQAAGLPFISLRPTLPRAPFLRDVERYMQSLELATHHLSKRINSALDDSFRFVFTRQAMSMIRIYCDLAAQLPAIFAQRGINLVVGTDTGSLAGRCYFRTAERMAIPTVFVQHGAFVQARAVATYFTDAQLLVWGASSRDTLVRSGVSRPERITCIGSAFEEETLGAAAKQSKAATSVVNKATFMVLVTFGVPGNLVEEGPFLKAAMEVIHAAEQLPNVEFVIKPHPGDKSRLWEKNTSEHGLRNVTIRPNADTYDLMRSCRVLVTMLSTTGAEAVYLGKPVVSVNLDHLPSGLDYIAFGAAYRIDQPKTLGALLRSLIDAPRDTDQLAEIRRNFAKHFLYREDRPAAERIVNYLECLIFGKSAATQQCVKS